MRLEWITAPGTFTGVRGEKFVKAKQNTSKLVLSKNRSPVKRLFKTLKHLKMKLFGRRYFRLVKGLTTPENTITYHNALCLSPQNFAEALFSVSPGAISNSQEKLKTILMQKFGVTNKEHYGMLWYFLNEKVLCIARKREDIYVVFFILSILAHLSTGLFQALR